MPPETAVATPAVAEAAVPAVKDTSAKSSELIAKYAAAEKAEPAAEAPKPAAEAPKPKVDPKTIKLETVKPEAKPEPEPEAVREKARYHLQHGDVAKAIETAFGPLDGIAIPDDVREALGRKLGIDSRGWEKFRKHEKQSKLQLAAKEQEVSQLVQRTLKEFEPFHLGRQAYEAGDLEGALKHAFGVDLNDFTRKVVSGRLEKNPEVEAVKAELERERQERKQFEKSLQDERTNAEASRDIQEYVQQLGADLAGSDDPDVAEYAKRPRFVHRVFKILEANFNHQTNVSVPVHVAAEMARDEVKALLSEWEHTGGSPAKADQASALPEQPTRTAARGRNLSHSRAAEATSSPRKLPTKDLISKYSKIIELSQTK